MTSTVITPAEIDLASTAKSDTSWMHAYMMKVRGGSRSVKNNGLQITTVSEEGNGYEQQHRECTLILLR